jgi:hypothetical protein
MQKGEITVLGSNSTSIQLRGYPSKVSVKFKHHFHNDEREENFERDHDDFDDGDTTPCNPTVKDHLEYSIHATNRHHGGYELRIIWKTSKIREIEWHVYF